MPFALLVIVSVAAIYWHTIVTAPVTIATYRSHISPSVLLALYAYSDKWEDLICYLSEHPYLQ